MCASLLLAGCGKKDAATTPGSMATQGGSVQEVQDGVDLAQISRDYRRWVVRNRAVASSFEDYVAKSKATVPPPPPGKKFALGKDNRIILISQ